MAQAMPQNKVAAIIGSGCSGLTAIKTCLDEGLIPVCFELSKDIGGLWQFSENVSDRRGSVASSTVMNTSKEMVAFSDFPPPKEFPNFMLHTKVLEYFSLYTDRFQLRPHIHFNTSVERILQTSGNHYVDADMMNNNNNSKVNNNKNNCNSNIQNISDNKKHSNPSYLDGNSTNFIDDCCCTTENARKITNETQNNRNEWSNASFTNEPEEYTNERKSAIKNNYNIYNVVIDDNKVDEANKIDSCTMKFPVECLDTQKAWMVRIKNQITGKTDILYFDCVFVCTGHHAYINMPLIPGQSDFKGKVIHSRDLRDPARLSGSRHVIVGVGNSGCDMAVEVSRRNKVFLATRHGTWLMQRLQTRGLPADIAYSNRMVFATAFSLPSNVLNFFCAQHLNQKIDHDLYGLRPRHGPVAAHPTVNDEIPNRIACGSVVVKPNIKRLLKNGVCFDDGSIERDIDTVIMATGYHIRYPFLDDSILSTKSNNVPLYLYMFPTSLVTHSLVVVGCVQPGGGLAPVSEMQCRLAAKVFKGEVKLPGQEVMEKDIRMRQCSLENRYRRSIRHTVQVDYIPYMDTLASMVGCKPDLGWMIVTDPVLAMKCIMGPCTAYQYRLKGPGCWNQAREAIMTQMDRVAYPLTTRRCEKTTTLATKLAFIILMAMAFVFGCFCFNL